MLSRILIFFFSGLPAAFLSAQTTHDPDTSVHFGHLVPCERYHSGNMKYSAEPYFGIKIIRKGNKQVEINPQTGARTVFRIEWISDCNYTLTFKKSNQPSRYKKGWKADVTITSSQEEYYDFKQDLHGIILYCTVQKDLSPSERKAKEKRMEDSLKQAKKDSIRIASGDTIPSKRDSLKAAKAAEKGKTADTKGKEEEVKGDPEAKGEGEKAEGKAKGEDRKAEGKKEGKKEKPAKEKKPKEKKEKPPKEKKEKPPKEKKEKPEEEEAEED